MNFKKISVSLLVFFLPLSSIVYAQSKNDKAVVGTVGKEKITYGEIKTNFLNGSPNEFNLESLEQFLPVYLQYKAKIQEAKKLGYFEDPGLNEEYNLYAKQAAYATILEDEIKPTEFESYYRKARKELKSSHILISLDPNATPSDTLSAYNLIMEARNKFINGSSMGELDVEYSSKRGQQSMGGDLPWFGVGTTVKPFEDVLYSLEVGEISMPVRTQFGYHIILLEDERPTTSPRNISHIYMREDPSALESPIFEAYEKLERGADWAETVILYSRDEPSKSKMGNIGWIEYGRYDNSFVDSVMALDPSLPFSKPVKTMYGYHIFRVDSVKSYENEEEERKELLKSFTASPNFTKSNAFVVSWLKNALGENENLSSLNKFKGIFVAKDSINFSNYPMPSFANETVYTFNKKKYSVKDFIEYLQNEYSGLKFTSYNDKWFTNFKDKIVDNQVVEIALNKFPDFKNQLNSYQTGLAVYKINENYMWSAETVDSTQLYSLYESNPKDYSYDTRYYYHQLTSTSDSVLIEAMDFIKDGNSPDSVRTYYPRVAVNKDSTGTFQEEPYDRLKLMQPSTFSEDFKVNRRSSVFYLNEILPARRMTFEEAFNRLLADYQPQREEKWIAKLNKDYKIKSDLKALRKAYKKDSEVIN